MEKAELDTVLFGADFVAGSSSGFGHQYSLQRNGWTISGYASIDGNAFDEIKPDPNKIQKIDFTLSSKGSSRRHNVSVLIDRIR